MPKKCHHIHYTPLKFNIAPENWWFFPDDPFLLGAVGNFFFRGELLDFGGVFSKELDVLVKSASHWQDLWRFLDYVAFGPFHFNDFDAA